MGLYDTVIFPKTFTCNKCGAKIDRTQTHLFENLMGYYEKGDYIPYPRPTAILKYCAHECFCGDELCKESREERSFFVYFILWHNILIEITDSYKDAEKILETFTIGDLKLLYDDLWQKMRKYFTKYDILRHWITVYHEYIKASEKEKERMDNILGWMLQLQFKDYVDLDAPILHMIEDLHKSEYPRPFYFDFNREDEELAFEEE